QELDSHPRVGVPPVRLTAGRQVAGVQDGDGLTDVAEDAGEMVAGGPDATVLDGTDNVRRDDADGGIGKRRRRRQGVERSRWTLGQEVYQRVHAERGDLRLLLEVEGRLEEGVGVRNVTTATRDVVEERVASRLEPARARRSVV